MSTPEEAFERFRQQINPIINQETEKDLQDPTAKTAAEQNSEYPLAWKPTKNEPVPVVRCVHVRSKDHPTKPGERCKNWSWRGLTKCYAHSGWGNFPNVNALREATLEAAELKILQLIPDAVDVQADLMFNSGSDAVRQTASKEILKLGGMYDNDKKVTVEVNHTINRVDLLSQKLKEISAKSTSEIEEAEIVDGEIEE